MVCLLQLSEQLHSSWWVQAQVRALLICDITTAAPWELIPNARQQLPAIRIDREELRAETHFCVCSCADSSLFFPSVFRVALFTVVRCKQRHFSHWTDDCLEHASLKSLKHLLETKVLNTNRWSDPPYSFSKKEKRHRQGTKTSRRSPFCFPKPSILWSGFHLHLILPLRNQRGMKSIFFDFWSAICYHTSEFYSLGGFRSHSVDCSTLSFLPLLPLQEIVKIF